MFGQWVPNDFVARFCAGVVGNGHDESARASRPDPGVSSRACHSVDL